MHIMSKIVNNKEIEETIKRILLNTRQLPRNITNAWKTNRKRNLLPLSVIDLRVSSGWKTKGVKVARVRATKNFCRNSNDQPVGNGNSGKLSPAFVPPR